LSQGAPARLQVDTTCLRASLQARYSHDNLSHTLMGLVDLSTSVYRPELDVLRACRG
jgi:lipid A ethanolaminephosphotransferase